MKERKKEFETRIENRFRAKIRVFFLPIFISLISVQFRSKNLFELLNGPLLSSPRMGETVERRDNRKSGGE